MKNTILYCIAVAIVFTFLGRLTAPVKTVEDLRKIDSLKRDIETREKSFSNYIIRSDQILQEAMANQRIKTITRTIYRNDTIFINRLTDIQLDSVFRARYPVNP